MLPFWIMDSDHSSAVDMDPIDADLERSDMVLDADVPFAPSATPAAAATASGKIRRCPCGRWMSSLLHDHHSFCSDCRGFECSRDQRCDECDVISDVQFDAYIKHQRSLKRKLLYKRKSKGKKVTVDPPLPPASDSIPSSSPPSGRSETGEDFISPVPSKNVGVSIDQIKELFGEFSRSVEQKFDSVNARIDSMQGSNASFSAPSVVAGRFEPLPDGPPLATCSEVLGAYPGGPATTVAPSGDGFPLNVEFGEFLARVRNFEYG